MLQEELVTHEVAKLAREKGFPVKEIECWHYEYDGHPTKEIIDEQQYPIITQSLLQKWLREEKAIAIVLQPYSYDIQRSTYTWIYEIWADNNFEKTSKSFKTYELALEDALKYTFKNLV